MKLNDAEILAAIKAGKHVRRQEWENVEPSLTCDSYDNMLMEAGTHPGPAMFSFTFYLDDLTAEDWVIADN